MQNRHLRAPPDQDGAPSPSPRGADGPEEQDGDARQAVRGEVDLVVRGGIPASRALPGPPAPVRAAAATPVRGRISGVVHGTAEDGPDRSAAAAAAAGRRRHGKRQLAGVPGRAAAAGPRPGGVHHVAGPQEEVQSHREALHLLKNAAVRPSVFSSYRVRRWSVVSICLFIF